MVEIFPENGKNKTPNFRPGEREGGRELLQNRETGHVKVTSQTASNPYSVCGEVKQLDWFCNSFYPALQSLL